MTLVIVIVFAGLIAGLIANRYLRQRIIKDDDEGPAPQDLLTSVEIFAALLIAIVLVDASATYSTARNVAADEANVVDNMFEATGYIKEERYKVGLQASLVCYARAVRGPSWEAMASGANSPALAAVPSNWTGTKPHGMRLKFQRMGTQHPMFETLVSLDRERGDTRRKRLSLAQPSVPKITSAFMLILVFLAVVTLAFFIPRRRNSAQRIAILIPAALFVCSLTLVSELDRPFSGLVRVEPTAMSITADDITADFLEDYGDKRLACNNRGEPR